jgi:Tfp pilus assembly protein PilN
LPGWLFLPGLPEKEAVPFRVASLPLDPATLRRAATLRRPISVVLDPSLALRRDLKLPKAALAQAQAAVDLQLRQTLPSGGEGLIWRVETTAQSGKQADLAAYLVKAHLVAGLVDDMKAAGVDLSTVELEGAKTEPFWQARAGSREQAKRWAAFTALIVALIATASVVYFELERSQLDDLVETRQARVSALEERVASASAEAQASIAEAQLITTDLATFAQQSRRLGGLVALTDALPDSVWISELSIAGDDLTLSGFTSEDVGDLMKSLQGLEWVSDVQLNGTVIFDNFTGQNRFDISFRLVAVDGQP